MAKKKELFIHPLETADRPVYFGTDGVSLRKKNGSTNRYQPLLNELKSLQAKVETALRKEVSRSKIKSKHIQGNVIKVEIYNYTELAIINNTLTFLDYNGLHYQLYSECSLDDLIELLQRVG